MPENGVKLQETLDERGNVDRVTLEPVEVWTQAGQSIIPPGYHFTGFSVPRWAFALLRPAEIPLLLLREWRETAGNIEKSAANAAFIRDLINYTKKRINAEKPPKMRRLATWGRVLLIAAGTIFNFLHIKRKRKLY